MEWVVDNADTIWVIVTSVVTIASAVAALTPSRKDDRAMKVVNRVIDFLALNWGHAKKEPK